MKKNKPTPLKIKSTLIAPCGMNCTLCIGHQREKKQCPGCLAGDQNKPKNCVTCVIKNCEKLTKSKSRFCYDCKTFPCARLKRLDKRYRTKYHMSMIENLKSLQALGIRQFVRNEKEKWACPNCRKVLSVHRENCQNCNHQIFQ